MVNFPLDAIGFILLCTILENGLPVDISSATELGYIFFQNQTGKRVEAVASLWTDGKDGKIAYTTTDKPLDLDSGNCKLQVHITMTGFSGYTDTTNLNIVDHI